MKILLFALFLFGRILFGQEIAVLQADFVKEKNTSDSTPSYDMCIKNQGLDEDSNCAKAVVIRDEHLAPDILFEGHTLKLKKHSLQLLVKYTTRVLLTPDVQVVVEGHTDTRLGNNESIKLGTERAKVVKEHMVRMGVDPNQIRVISKGNSEPRNDCKEAETCSKEMHDENNSVLLYSNRLLTLLPQK